MNKKVLYNDGWEFAKSSLDVTDSAGLQFEPVDLPHDWLIYNTLDLYENSIGWYRKKLEWTWEQNSERDQERGGERNRERSGERGRGVKQALLYFDGVYMDSTLFVNRKNIGEWKYGYSSFEHDITDALIDGENEILVRVVHQSPNSRWYSGAGIYRNVWLKTRGKSYIETNGVYVSIKKSDKCWKAEIGTEIHAYEDVCLSHTITYKGRIIASSSNVIRLASEREATTLSDMILDSQTLFVEDPHLWSPESPELYCLTTVLAPVAPPSPVRIEEPSPCFPPVCIEEPSPCFPPVRIEEPSPCDTCVIECITQNIGFRDIVLDPDCGLLLNGKKIKLNGVCEHHDLGALGAAFNITALRRRFAILKEMGVNAIRTAHNMPAPELMDLADEMGMLVLSEAFDMWERPKTTFDYARFFNDWAHIDVKSWVTRDRNHPSLLMWSIGNEIYDTYVDERGQAITEMLMDSVHKYDPKHNAEVTVASNYMPWENAQKCADILKIAGYNYTEKYYHKHHEEHPDWVIFGSETASVVQSRGVYHFPFERQILSDDDEQCSSLGNSSTSWGARSAEACITDDRDAPFSLGQFIWTGFDYIGEPTPYHTKNSYFGQIDTAAFKKDSYYIYQAAWTDYKEKPMVHIFPYWDFNKGQIIDVRVCSNAPGIELKFDGVTVGTYDIDHEHGIELVATWKIPYREGVLEAIAYDEKGSVIATDVKRSFKDAKEICLNADKTTLAANGTDLIFLEIAMKDEDGNIVENANNRVRVNVEGEGRLLGLDNGDSTDYDQYKGLSRRLFNGRLTAIIGATLNPGKIRVEVSSKGMETLVAGFESFMAADAPCQANNASYQSDNASCPAADESYPAADAPCQAGNVPCPIGTEAGGISAFMKNREMPCIMGNNDEIPLRKIEILNNMGQLLSESQKEIRVQAKLHPHDTSYCDLEWSVVNDAGIESNIAVVEPNGLEAKVTALGDGRFRLRCTSRNGTDRTKLISQLEFEATGLGKIYKNPYSFISAGLYDYSKGEVGSGNEKGVTTGGEGESQIGFRDIDFGAQGSDTITIPVFALSDEKHFIEIWEGIPGEEGSMLLANAVYQKENIWNTYQQETWRLSKKLRGVTSICLVLRQRVHIKGFCFSTLTIS